MQARLCSKMAVGKKTVTTSVVVLAVVVYYAVLPMAPNVSTSDAVKLRLAAFVQDTVIFTLK